MSNEPLAEIRSKYEDPIIENQECPFPNIELVSVFEKRDEAEDPLLTDRWFIYSEDQVSQDILWDHILLEPNSIDAAIKISKWLISTLNWDLEVEFDNIRIVDDEFPQNLSIEILTKISTMHSFFEMDDTDIKEYLVNIHAGMWSIQ